MNTMIKRSMSASFALSILLSATPMYAKSFDVSAFGRWRDEDHMADRSDDDSGTGAKVHMKIDHRGRSDEMKVEITAEQRTKILEHLEKRTTSAIKRSVNLLAKFVKRACGATESTDSAIAACVAKVKNSLKAEFQVMIDAAFGA